MAGALLQITERAAGDGIRLALDEGRRLVGIEEKFARGTDGPSIAAEIREVMNTAVWRIKVVEAEKREALERVAYFRGMAYRRKARDLGRDFVSGFIGAAVAAIAGVVVFGSIVWGI